MIGIVGILIVLAGANVPLLFWICRTFRIHTFPKIFALEWAMYVLYALAFGAVFALADAGGDPLESIKAAFFLAGFGMVLFCIPFAVLFYFLARWVESKVKND